MINKKLDNYGEISEEFKRHIIDCNDSKRAHFDLADYYYKKAQRIDHLQGFGLGIVITWLLSNQFSGFLPNNHLFVVVTPTILAIIVSVLSTLKPILKYHEKALVHESCAKKYHTLWRTCKNWQTDFPNDTFLNEARVAVQRYREILNDINRDAPHLSSILWPKINKIRSNPSYIDVSRYSFEKDNSPC